MELSTVQNGMVQFVDKAFMSVEEVLFPAGVVLLHFEIAPKSFC